VEPAGYAIIIFFGDEMTECPTCHAKLPERKGLYICPKCGCKWYEKQSQRKPLIKEIEIIEIGKVKENE